VEEPSNDTGKPLPERHLADSKKEAELRIFPVRLDGIEQCTPCEWRAREVVLGDQCFHESDPVKTAHGQNQEHMIGG
jgi:hypothetical protein